MIRYCEEEVEINDVGQFRTEIDVTPNYLNTVIYLEAELLFADMIELGGPDKWQQHAAELEEKVEFKNVSSVKFAIHGALQGLHEYLQLVFDENHFCVANGMFHTVLLDYRFRMTN